MKIIGVQSKESYLVELHVCEFNALTGGDRREWLADLCLVGRSYEISKAWNTIRELRQHRDELPRIAGKLRALADLLEPIECELPTTDTSDCVATGG